MNIFGDNHKIERHKCETMLNKVCVMPFFGIFIQIFQQKAILTKFVQLIYLIDNFVS